jgi:glycosyltransferase involved in cell wall biosynthesis
MPDTDCITAVIITKNEEKNIERCIDSLHEIADEIIVVDSFSDDRTVDICEKKGVRVFKKQWMGYSESKNYGISLASNRYILSLDADEALSDELRDSLLKLKNRGINFGAYRMNRLTNYCGKWIHHCGWYPDKKLRLWNKDLGRWEGSIHEEVKLTKDVEIGILEGDILHYSYYTINEHLQRISTYTDLLAEEFTARHRSVSYVKIMCSPPLKFIKCYFFQEGFKDGFYGLVICILSSVATFLKYVKSRQIIEARLNH